MSKHWELSGPVRKAVLGMLKARSDKLEEAAKYIRSLGGRAAKAESGIGCSFAVEFTTPPDPLVWKSCKETPGVYLPRRTSKEGKAIWLKLEKLGRTVPSGDQIGNAIGMSLFSHLSDGRWYTPGVAVKGRRVFVKTPDGYTPPTTLKAHVKRVSDLVYEAA